MTTWNNAIASIWTYRERVEQEAADQFERLAAGLSAIRADSAVIALARRSAEDERRHSVFCREILSEVVDRPTFLKPELGAVLGPPDLDVRNQMLYAAVSIGCVTETLSTALLIEMRKLAGPAVVRKTVQSILEDEIDHSRIGWAHLAHESKNQDVQWLSAYLRGMIREAVNAELPNPAAKPTGLEEWGILSGKQAREIQNETLQKVVLPGLRSFGIELVS